MNQTLLLRIDKHESLRGNFIEITWEPNFELADRAAVKEYKEKCSIDAYHFTTKSYKKVMELLNRDAIKEREKDGLIRAGKTLYNNFVEKNFYREYADKSAEIFISSPMVYVPWELVLCPDNSEPPWGVKYSIGNQIRSPLDVKEKAIPDFKEDIDVLLIGANTRDNLEYVDKEIREIRDSLLAFRPNIQCEILVVDPDKFLENEQDKHPENVKYYRLDYDTVLGKLQEEKFDIIHYAGHIDPPKENDIGLGSALVLEQIGSDKNRLLYSKDIYDNLGGTPFVFLNGCSMMWEKAPLIITTIADGFIFGGARGVLVPRTEINDADAKRIATTYYEYILKGFTFGEALRKIREFEYNEAPTNINWITYTLFGKPGTRLFSMERKVFFYNSNVKANILNEKIFEEETIQILKTAAYYALKSDINIIEIEHVLLAMTHTPLFAALFAMAAKDDLWKVIKDVRLTFWGSEQLKFNVAEHKEEIMQLPIKEEYIANEVKEILKKTHQQCDKDSLTKIRTQDLIRTVLSTDNAKLKNTIEETVKKHDLLGISTVNDVVKILSQIGFPERVEELLSQNLFTIDGEINTTILTKNTDKILKKSALFYSLDREALAPEDIFYIASLIQGTFTKKFFEANKFEYNEFAKLIQETLSQKIEEDIELQARMLNPDCEAVLKKAAAIAKFSAAKLSEKHLIRSLLDYAKSEGGEAFPNTEFLSELELETISWKEY